MANFKELIETGLKRKTGSGITYAEAIVLAQLKIAANPREGAAATKACSTLLHLIGQDQLKDDRAIEVLEQILEETRRNALAATPEWAPEDLEEFKKAGIWAESKE